MKKVPDLPGKLTALVEAETGGDPMTDRKWVRSSLRHLSDLLRKQGVAICRGTVGRLLKKLGYLAPCQREAPHRAAAPGP